MPCLDGGPYWENEVRRPTLRKSKASKPKPELTKEALEAILCGIATKLENMGNLNTVTGLVDWKEVGVAEENFFKWWDDHKAKDEIRREKILKNALAKLTAEERKVLGLE